MMTLIGPVAATHRPVESKSITRTGPKAVRCSG